MLLLFLVLSIANYFENNNYEKLQNAYVKTLKVNTELFTIFLFKSKNNGLNIIGYFPLIFRLKIVAWFLNLNFSYRLVIIK